MIIKEKIPTNILNSENFKCKISQNKIIFLNSNKKSAQIPLPSYTKALLNKENSEIIISLLDVNKKKEFNSLRKTLSSKLKNAINGINQGFIKQLILKGIGFKVFIAEDKKSLTFKLGYSHNINLVVPNEIDEIIIVKSNELFLKSSNLDVLTQYCSIIKNLIPVNVYKGKGIFYKDETIKLREGKRNK